jgi:hypothetical protein
MFTHQILHFEVFDAIRLHFGSVRIKPNFMLICLGDLNCREINLHFSEKSKNNSFWKCPVQILNVFLFRFRCMFCFTCLLMFSWLILFNPLLHSGPARSIFAKWSRKLWRHLRTLLQIAFIAHTNYTLLFLEVLIVAGNQHNLVSEILRVKRMTAG